jgi:hypothetical protein
MDFVQGHSHKRNEQHTENPFQVKKCKQAGGSSIQRRGSIDEADRWSTGNFGQWSCTSFSLRDSSCTTKMIRVVRSSGDRWQLVGNSGIVSLEDKLLSWVSKPRNTKCDSLESLTHGHGLRFGGKVGPKEEDRGDFDIFKVKALM